MSVSSSWDVSSDAELITAVRSGDAAAFGVLYERHAGAARAVAHQYSNSAADADDSVAEAFSRVFTAIQAGGGPDVAFRAYLFTVIRRVALHGAHSGRRTQTTDDLDVLEAAFGLGDSTEDPTFEGFERSVVSRAYKSLPERWQAVLWYTEVEQLSAAQIAPVLGLSANGVAALAYRAREGLRQAYLQQHLASPASEACTIVNAKLGAYVRGGLAKRETSLVESHLEECGDCRSLVLELGDVNHGMRVVIAPLVLGAVAISVLHGIGFGGAIGSAAAAAGSGAAAGAGAGAGTGGAAGTSVGVGSGSLVGAGAGASGLVGAGAVAGGAAALVAAGGPAAASPGAPVVAGGGASGATGATGLAALVSSVPVGAVGLAAAGLVVALAVGVSGMLGLFSGDDLPTVAAPEQTNEEVPESVPGDAPDEESPTPDDPADPQVPGAPPAIPAVAGPGFSAPEATDPTPEPTTPAPDPTTPAPDPTTPAPDPTTPPPTPPDEPPPPPADLIVASGFSGSTLVAGVPQTIETQIRNPGTTAAGPVHTEFSFPAGSGVVVSALAAAPLGGPGAILAFSAPDWTCDTVVTAELDTVTCTIAEIGPGVTSTLGTTITVQDAVVDGEHEIEIGTRTWAEPSPPPAATAVPVRVASAPARLSVFGPEGAESYVRSGSPRELTFTATNTGSTTATGLTAVVDLPEAVFWAGEVPGSDWTCAEVVGANRQVTCELDPAIGLAPTAARDLVVRVRAEGSGTRAVTGTISAANGRGGTASGGVTVSITAVPGSVVVYVAPTTITPNTSAHVPITIVNLGDVAITNLQADLVKEAGALSWQPGTAGTGWTCWSAGGQIDISCQPADRTLAPGATTTLYPQVITPASPDGQRWFSTVRVMGEGMAVGNQVEETFAVTISRTAGADGAFVGAYVAV